MYETFRAVVSAASVTHTFRAPFATGCVSRRDRPAVEGDAVGAASDHQLRLRRAGLRDVHPRFCEQTKTAGRLERVDPGMYSAKHRAVAPLVTATFSATEQVGKLMFFSPAFDASALMPAGVMSVVPTICCCLRFEVTVEPPAKPMAIATTPNATSTTAVTIPPISKCLAHLDSPSSWPRHRERPALLQSWAEASWRHQACR